MESSKQEMERVLQLQKQFLITNGPPSNALRIDRIERLKSMLNDNRYKFVNAMTIYYVCFNIKAAALSEERTRR